MTTKGGNLMNVLDALQLEVEQALERFKAQRNGRNRGRGTSIPRPRGAGREVLRKVRQVVNSGGASAVGNDSGTSGAEFMHGGTDSGICKNCASCACES